MHLKPCVGSSVAACAVHDDRCIRVALNGIHSPVAEVCAALQNKPFAVEKKVVGICIGDAAQRTVVVQVASAARYGRQTADAEAVTRKSPARLTVIRKAYRRHQSTAVGALNAHTVHCRPHAVDIERALWRTYGILVFGVNRYGVFIFGRIYRLYWSVRYRRVNRKLRFYRIKTITFGKVHMQTGCVRICFILPYII